MRQILQTILFSFILIVAVSVTATANNGGENDDVHTHHVNTDIRVYPNPAIDYIMVTENDEVAKVWIYNILGKRVKSYKAEGSETKYDIRDLPRGMYIVRLIDNSGDLIMTRRINKINP